MTTTTHHFFGRVVQRFIAKTIADATVDIDPEVRHTIYLNAYDGIERQNKGIPPESFEALWQKLMEEENRG